MYVIFCVLRDKWIYVQCCFFGGGGGRCVKRILERILLWIIPPPRPSRFPLVNAIMYLQACSSFDITESILHTYIYRTVWRNPLPAHAMQRCTISDDTANVDFNIYNSAVILHILLYTEGKIKTTNHPLTTMESPVSYHWLIVNHLQ